MWHGLKQRPRVLFKPVRFLQISHIKKGLKNRDRNSRIKKEIHSKEINRNEKHSYREKERDGAGESVYGA